MRNLCCITWFSYSFSIENAQWKRDSHWNIENLPTLFYVKTLLFVLLSPVQSKYQSKQPLNIFRWQNSNFYVRKQIQTQYTINRKSHKRCNKSNATNSTRRQTRVGRISNLRLSIRKPRTQTTGSSEGFQKSLNMYKKNLDYLAFEGVIGLNFCISPWNKFKINNINHPILENFR